MKRNEILSRVVIVCGFSGFSTVGSPRTAGVTDNPRPPPLSGEPPIGLGAGGKNPGPGGHPGGPLTRRCGPVARVRTQRGVPRSRLPYGAPPARCAPPLANSENGVYAGLAECGHGLGKGTYTKPYISYIRDRNPARDMYRSEQRCGLDD
jgi:hypothetical protein